MNKVLRWAMAGLAAVSIGGCGDPGKIEAVDDSVKVEAKKRDNQVIITIGQDLRINGLDENTHDFSANLNYTPLTISFTDFPDIEEVPRPLPLRLFSDSISESGQIIVDYTGRLDELTEQHDIFGMPFKIRGKQRETERSLDYLIASGEVEPLEEISLGSISVNYSTSLAYRFTGVNVSHEKHHNYYLPDVDNFFFQIAIDKLRLVNFSSGGLRYTPVRLNEIVDESDVKPLKRYFDEEKIKNLANEMLWQLGQVEGVEGLFHRIEGYERANNTKVTHFAVVPKYGFGLGQTFESESESYSKTGFFSSSSDSKADAEGVGRYSIHLTGIIATSNPLLE